MAFAVTGPDKSPDFQLRPVTTADAAAISALHARVFGPGRFTRTAYRVREGTPLHSPFCRAIVFDGRIVAAIRMTGISIGGMPGALLLGPLAVEAALANLGHGRRLLAAVADDAGAAGRRLILLVGNEPYYGRLGYVRVPAGQILLPGPVDPARLLALELTPGALAGYHGTVAADPRRT